MFDLISSAYAQSAPVAHAANPVAGVSSLVPIFLIFGVFYFMVMRPQQKQQQALQKMIASARVGDDIITSSGIHGRITEADEKLVSVQIASNTIIKLDRSHIQTIKGYKAS